MCFGIDDKCLFCMTSDPFFSPADGLHPATRRPRIRRHSPAPSLQCGSAIFWTDESVVCPKSGPEGKERIPFLYKTFEWKKLYMMNPVMSIYVCSKRPLKKSMFLTGANACDVPCIASWLTPVRWPVHCFRKSLQGQARALLQEIFTRTSLVNRRCIRL
jgi:hypothetical protein